MDIRLKNSYGRLGITILIRTILLVLLATVVGGGICSFLEEDMSQDSFVMIILIELAVFLLAALVNVVRRMAGYLNHIDGAVEKVIGAEEGTIILQPEL